MFRLIPIRQIARPWNTCFPNTGRREVLLAMAAVEKSMGCEAKFDAAPDVNCEDRARRATGISPTSSRFETRTKGGLWIGVKATHHRTWLAPGKALIGCAATTKPVPVAS